MKISILTPSYNRAAIHLPACIESVQNQHGSVDYEHIIIDDGSTDNTREYLQEAADRNKRIVPVFSSTNEKTAHALNLGFLEATGEFILPLDDDDLLLPYSLELHTNFLRQNPDVELSFGHVVLIGDDSKLKLWNNKIDFNSYNYSDDNEEFYRLMLKGDQVRNGSAIISRQAVEDVGGWNEDVSCQDWEMFLKLIYSRKVHKRNPSYLSCYRIHAEQLTTVQSEDGTWERDAEYLERLYGVRS